MPDEARARSKMNPGYEPLIIIRTWSKIKSEHPNACKMKPAYGVKQK